MRQVYINGSFMPADKATVSIFDRGFLFADAVYEVTSVLGGKLIDFDGHMARLKRSLKALNMSQPVLSEELKSIHRELIRLNGLTEGLIYLQISRGKADRDFIIQDKGPATIVLFSQEKSLIDSPLGRSGQKVISVKDRRWGLSDIKTVQLLYSSLMKSAAKKQGADDVWFQNEGFVTEGSSSNAFVVTPTGTIVTRDLSEKILPGITRSAVIKCAASLDMEIEERPFSLEEALKAKEAFCTSATSFVTPVIEIDGVVIGDGKPGQVSRQLRRIYVETSLAAGI